jgi:hypothetical protein
MDPANLLTKRHWIVELARGSPAKVLFLLHRKGADALGRRPQPAAALAEARGLKCAIVVAKLDRLSRNVEFISGLMSRRVPSIVAALGRDSRSVHAAHLCRAGRAGASHDLTANHGCVD